MMLFVITALAALCTFCTSAPIIRQQLGIIASNSNEIFRLNGLTLAGVNLGQGQVQMLRRRRKRTDKGTPFLSPFLFQPQPDILLPPQIVNFGPQLPGPFLPPQQNQVPPMLVPSVQQEQPSVPLNPNNPLLNQNPPQVIPQFYPFPQGPGTQGFPYYLMYGFPSGNTPVRFPPNQRTGPQNPIRPTQRPLQPVLHNNGKASDPWRLTPPPDNRGDRPGPGVAADPAFSIFEP